MKRALAAIFILAIGCASAPEKKPARASLSEQLDDASAKFFTELKTSGAARAQSYFTLFVPDDAVHKRYRKDFLDALERSIGKNAASADLHYQASAEKALFWTKRTPKEEFKPPPGEPEVLAREMRNGTTPGWTILHAFFGQYNRLLVGDDEWIQSLPESVRADLSHPLSYVLRVRARETSAPDPVTHVHAIAFELIAVGGEEVVLAKDYEVTLTFRLP